VVISFLIVLFRASVVRRAAHTLRAPRGRRRCLSGPRFAVASYQEQMMWDNDDNDEDDDDSDIIVRAHRAQLAM